MSFRWVVLREHLVARQRPSKENIILGYILNTNIYARLMCLRVAIGVTQERTRTNIFFIDQSSLRLITKSENAE